MTRRGTVLLLALVAISGVDANRCVRVTSAIRRRGGAAWQVLDTSVWGINSNQAKVMSGFATDKAAAVVESNYADCSVEVLLVASRRYW